MGGTSPQASIYVCCDSKPLPGKTKRSPPRFSLSAHLLELSWFRECPYDRSSSRPYTQRIHFNIQWLCIFILYAWVYLPNHVSSLSLIPSIPKAPPRLLRISLHAPKTQAKASASTLRYCIMLPVHIRHCG